MESLAPLVERGREVPAMSPGYRKLDVAVDETVYRLRAEYMGISLSPRMPDAYKERVVSWIRDGAPVDDELRYLAWLKDRTPG